MYDRDQFHQKFIASSTSREAEAPSSSSPIPPPAASTLIPPNFHGFDPFPNPNPTSIPPPPHNLLHLQPQPTSLALLHHHKDHAIEHEDEGIKEGHWSLLPVSILNFDTDSRVNPSVAEAREHRMWSNEEMTALLKIGPEVENWYPEVTWEHVSRKLAKVGIRRSAEECKEKFEEQTRSSSPFLNNISYSKQNDDNNYRMLVNELEELYDHRIHPNTPDVPGMKDGDSNAEKLMGEEPKDEGERLGQNNVMEEADDPQAMETGLFAKSEKAALIVEHEVLKKRKRQVTFKKFKRFCGNIVERLIAQQEEIHNKLLDDMMKRDREMVEKEEALKKTEMERINKQLDLRAQEHVVARNRKDAIIELLKRFTSPNSHESHKDDRAGVNKDSMNNDPPNLPLLPDLALFSPDSNASTKAPQFGSKTTIKISDGSNTGKRWPREEVLALINMRCNIRTGHDENKGDQHPVGATKMPLWERISRGMSELGYTRSAKRCKEKWENINKYFRKTKDSNLNQKRSLDSRTCPYFHQLTALYSQRNEPATASSPRNDPNSPSGTRSTSSQDVR